MVPSGALKDLVGFLKETPGSWSKLKSSRSANEAQAPSLIVVSGAVLFIGAF